MPLSSLRVSLLDKDTIDHHTYGLANNSSWDPRAAPTVRGFHFLYMFSTGYVDEAAYTAAWATTVNSIDAEFGLDVHTEMVGKNKFTTSIGAGVVSDAISEDSSVLFVRTHGTTIAKVEGVHEEGAGVEAEDEEDVYTEGEFGDVTYVLRLSPQHGDDEAHHIQVCDGRYRLGSIHITRTDAPAGRRLELPEVAREMMRAHFPLLAGVIRETMTRMHANTQAAMESATGNGFIRVSHHVLNRLLFHHPADGVEHINMPTLTKSEMLETQVKPDPEYGLSAAGDILAWHAFPQLVAGPSLRNSMSVRAGNESTLRDAINGHFRNNLMGMYKGGKYWTLSTGTQVFARYSYGASAPRFETGRRAGMREGFFTDIILTVIRPGSSAAVKAAHGHGVPSSVYVPLEHVGCTARVRVFAGVSDGLGNDQRKDAIVHAAMDDPVTVFDMPYGVDKADVFGPCAAGPCVCNGGTPAAPCVHFITRKILGALRDAYEQRLAAWHIRNVARKFTTFGIAMASCKPEPVAVTDEVTSILAAEASAAAVALASIPKRYPTRSLEARVAACTAEATPVTTKTAKGLSYAKKIKALEIALRECAGPGVKVGHVDGGAAWLRGQRERFVAAMLPQSHGDAAPDATETGKAQFKALDAFLYDAVVRKKEGFYGDYDTWAAMDMKTRELAKMEAHRLVKD